MTSNQLDELVVEFMEEFYAYICRQTPTFMTRPASEEVVRATLEALMVQVATAKATAATSEELILGMTPLVQAMRDLIVDNCDAEHTMSWLGQLEEFRLAVIEELTGGS